MGFEAKYHGRCADCGEHIAPGDRVRYDDDRLVHDNCEASATPDPTVLRPDEIVCESCWLVKPCGCEDGL